MAYRTAHTSAQTLASTAGDRLAALGHRLLCFPYNRYAVEHTTWWLSEKASPAHAAVKLFVGPVDGSAQMYAGLVVEKGLEYPDVPPTQRFDSNWDWSAVTSRMRQAAFAELVERQAVHKVRLRVHGIVSPPKGVPIPPQLHRLAFRFDPWSRTLDEAERAPDRILASAADAASLGALLDGLESLRDRRFIWLDLMVAVPLLPARAGDDPVALDERLVDQLLVPLGAFAWRWPTGQEARS